MTPPHLDAPTLDAIAFVATDTPVAQEGLRILKHRYGHVAPEQAQAIVALGGDGFMLETLHRYLALGRPIYGMNRGTVGFLMNAFNDDNLPARLAQAAAVALHPLRMKATAEDGEIHEALAFNEVSLLRETRQAAKLRIAVDGRVRIPELICDGALVCTAAGSTAYNLSAHGPILPMNANAMALTAISAFRPRRWRSAILNHTARVSFSIIEGDKRPVAAVADFTEVRDVVHVEVREDREVSMTLLFDPEHNLEERILAEQFTA